MCKLSDAHLFTTHGVPEGQIPEVHGEKLLVNLQKCDVLYIWYTVQLIMWMVSISSSQMWWMLTRRRQCSGVGLPIGVRNRKKEACRQNGNRSASKLLRWMQFSRICVNSIHDILQCWNSRPYFNRKFCVFLEVLYWCEVPIMNCGCLGGASN